VAKDVPEGAFPWDEADRMFTLLVKRAAEFSDCKPGSPEETNCIHFDAGQVTLRQCSSDFAACGG